MMVVGRILSPHITDASVKNMEPSEAWRKTYILIRAVCLLISILGIIGNGMVIFLLSCKIKKTRFTIYVLCMTIADFILIFSDFIDNVFFFKPTRMGSFLSLTRYIGYVFGNDASIYFLTVICAERYLMLFLPAWYHSHRPKYFTPLTCVVLWVLALVATFLEYFSCHPRYFFKTNLRCDIVFSIHFIYNFMNISVMLLSTSTLFIRIQRSSQRNLLTKLDISIMAAVVRILIFWVPIVIFGLLHLWVPHQYLPDYYAVFLIFDSINATACPYIYLVVGWWKSQELQRSIPIFIERALKHTEENTSTAIQDHQEQA